MSGYVFCIHALHFLLYLSTRSQQTFSAKVDGKYFSLSGPYGLFCSYLTLLLQCGSSRSQYGNTWAWVDFNTILFTKINNGLDLSQWAGCQLSCFEQFFETSTIIISHTQLGNWRVRETLITILSPDYKNQIGAEQAQGVESGEYDSVSLRLVCTQSPFQSRPTLCNAMD